MKKEAGSQVQIEDLTPYDLTKAHVLELIGKLNDPSVGTLSEIIAEQQKASDGNSRFSLGPHNNLEELIGGLSNRGLVLKIERSEIPILSLTAQGKRVVTTLPDGIFHALWGQSSTKT